MASPFWCLWQWRPLRAAFEGIVEAFKNCGVGWICYFLQERENVLLLCGCLLDCTPWCRSFRWSPHFLGWFKSQFQIVDTKFLNWPCSLQEVKHSFQEWKNVASFIAHNSPSIYDECQTLPAKILAWKQVVPRRQYIQQYIPQPAFCGLRLILV